MLCADTYIYLNEIPSSFSDFQFPSSSCEVRLLTGHSGPVFGTSFNPDNSFLISGSEDGTGGCGMSVILYRANPAISLTRGRSRGAGPLPQDFQCQLPLASA